MNPAIAAYIILSLSPYALAYLLIVAAIARFSRKPVAYPHAGY